MHKETKRASLQGSACFWGVALHQWLIGATHFNCPDQNHDMSQNVIHQSHTDTSQKNSSYQEWSTPENLNINKMHSTNNDEFYQSQFIPFMQKCKHFPKTFVLQPFLFKISITFSIFPYK